MSRCDQVANDRELSWRHATFVSDWTAKAIP